MREIKTVSCIICLSMLIGQTSCQGQSTYFPRQNWRESAPAEQGLDELKINAFIEQLQQGDLQSPITSLTIVKNGYLVVKETFDGYNGEQTHTLQSVTKSVTSTLIGVAIQQGMIKDLDEKVLSFFPEYQKVDHLNENKKSMNLRHALTMRTGQAWTGERHLGPLNRFTGDRMKYVLDYEMETEPGRKWYYNSGIAMLLGGLLQNATKMDTRDFAQEYLFEPLGIARAKWNGDHNGIPHTGGGLYLKPTDMARIGYLYLQNGVWAGKQILPDWWVADATKRHVTQTNQIPGFPEIGYGYMWWLAGLDRTAKEERGEIYMAYGHWGQFIFVIPAYHMVITFTNDNTASYRDEIKPISLLYEYLLPAVSRN